MDGGKAWERGRWEGLGMWTVGRSGNVDGGKDWECGRWEGLRTWTVGRTGNVDGGKDWERGRWEGLGTWTVGRPGNMAFVRLFVAAAATVYQEPHFRRTERQKVFAFLFDQNNFHV